MSVVTLEAVTVGKGFISDGDWIESKDQDPSGNIRLIQLADIGDGRFLNKSQRYINDATFHSLNCTRLQAGDVLIARMPDPLGRACLFPEIEEPAITAVDVCIIRPNSDLVDADWLVFRLNSPVLRQKVQNHAQGATRARVPTGKLRTLQFELPTINTQRRVAARLKNQLAEVEKARQAAEAQLRDVYLLGARYKEQSMNMLATAPRIVLGDVLHGIEAGKSFQTTDRRAGAEELGVLKVSAVSWERFMPDEAKAVASDYAPDERHRVRKGDLIISRANTLELVGAVVRVEDDFPLRLLSDKTLRLLIDEKRVLPDYILAILKWPEARAHIEGNATGTSDSMRNISQQTINSIPIPWIPLQEQEVVIAKVKAFDIELNRIGGTIQRQLDELSKLPAKILTQAFGDAA